MRQPYRRHKGPRWSEATRLLWCALEAHGVSHAQEARAAGCSRSEFTRIIYGDKPPPLGPAAHFQRTWGIDVGLWDQPETVEFILPALRDDVSGSRHSSAPDGQEPTGTDG